MKEKSDKRTVSCTFTRAEADHILSLIFDSEKGGEYLAPKKQYWARSHRIRMKLQLLHEPQ